jgi:SAM-dependent methyltransferase
MNEKDWDDVSNDYYDEILSPLKNCSSNPLFKDIEKLKGDDKKVIDLGCGLGELEKFLSENYGEVKAIDFSKEMIESAKERNHELKNVKFSVLDMKELDINKEYDLAVSVNSIIMDNPLDIDIILKNIHNLLKSDGKFIAILPSMEVFAYQSLLIIDREMKNGKNLEEARGKARDFIKNKEHDFLSGIYDFDGKQKAYYQFEILWRLKKAGFRNIKIKKVYYSWTEFKEAGQSYFPEEDLPWDWYVICDV